MRLLDLCCGAGGAAEGYARAGFEVVGVDVLPQPHYPFTFHQADALTFPLDGFDAYHASPPCQAYSVTRSFHPETAAAYPVIIEPLRERLQATGSPYVIENVPGAPLIDPVMLCGSMFRLRTVDGWLKRHRLFECNFAVHQLECAHPDHIPCLGVYGGGGRVGSTRRGTAYERRDMMGIWWMTTDELNEAIPPAYTEYIGAHILAGG